jgi:organic hydroperoxide reductase OsmC/OhrA
VDPVHPLSSLELPQFTIVEVTAYWSGGYRCRVPIRQFELIADEPETVAGGTDTGPMPTELFLASLAACFTMALAHIARKRRVELPDDLAVSAIGDYTGHGFGALRVEVSSSHPAGELERMLEWAAGVCYVSNTLRNAPEVEYVIRRA